MFTVGTIDNNDVTEIAKSLFTGSGPMWLVVNKTDSKDRIEIMAVVGNSENSEALAFELCAILNNAIYGPEDRNN